MTNPRIVFGQPQEPALPPENPPPAALGTGVGIRPHGPFQVYFVKGVYDAILAHINETPHVESGGILVGQSFRTPDRQTVFIIITAAIRQDSDNRSVGHFTVTHTEVQAARAMLEAHYPGYQVVGWYHSHPGHGVFLSGQDMTIVRSIYNASWQLALVIDPLQQIEGIFVGPEGKLLGGPGKRSFGSSWTELRQAPATVAARAYFNQAQEAAESGRRDVAVAALGALNGLIKDSPELRHWGNRYPGYEDLCGRVDGMVNGVPAVAQPTAERPTATVIGRPPNISSRPAVPPRNRSLTAGLIVVAFVILGYFLAVLLALRQQAITSAFIAWGSALTMLVGLGAVTLLQRDRDRHEHALGYALLAAVLFVWAGVAVLSDGRPPDVTTLTPTPPTPLATDLPALLSTTSPPPTPAVTPTALVTATATMGPPTPEPSPTIEMSPTPDTTVTPEPPTPESSPTVEVSSTAEGSPTPTPERAAGDLRTTPKAARS